MSVFLGLSILTGIFGLATGAFSPSGVTAGGCNGHPMVDGWLIIPDSGGAIIEERQRFILIARAQGLESKTDQEGNLWLTRGGDIFYMVKFRRRPFLGLTVLAKSIDRVKQDVTCASAPALLALGQLVSDEFTK